MSKLEYEIEEHPGDRTWWEVAPDLWFPRSIAATGPAPGMPSHYEIDAGFLYQDGYSSYQLGSIHIASRRPEVDITARALKSLTLTDLKSGLSDFGRSRLELPDNVDHLGSLPETARETQDARLVSAAHAYARARISGGKPAEAVRDALGVTTSTANYWIRRLKDLRLVRISHADREWDEALDALRDLPSAAQESPDA